METMPLSEYTANARKKLMSLFAHANPDEPWCIVTSQAYQQPTRRFEASARLADALVAKAENAELPDAVFAQSLNDDQLDMLHETLKGLPESMASKSVTWLQLVLMKMFHHGVLKVNGDPDAEARPGDTITIMATPGTGEE